MKKLISFLITALTIVNIAYTQTKTFSDKLYESYSEFKEEGIQSRRFKHQDILRLIDKLKGDADLEIRQVGESIEGKSLNLISLGDGDTDVFLWSQMHGDESTATMAIFDILNFFNSDEFTAEKK